MNVFSVVLMILALCIVYYLVYRYQQPLIYYLINRPLDRLIVFLFQIADFITRSEYWKYIVITTKLCLFAIAARLTYIILDGVLSCLFAIYKFIFNLIF